MSKKVLLVLLLIPLLINLVYNFSSLSQPKVEVKPIAQEEKPISDQVVTIEAKQLDRRAQILQDYLAQKNSPLQYHAQDLIEAADFYQVDWRLVTAISGVESGFGKITPGGYNGWGWGVYGDNRIYFSTWRDGIFTVTKGLRENYINRGLKDPYSMNRVYASSPTWGSKVSFFLADIDAFSKQYPETELHQEQVVKVSEAGNSAKLALSK